MLGTDIFQTTVAKYMFRRRKPPSQTGPTFLDNHVGAFASTDLYTVPTVTFRNLYVFLVIKHERRLILHYNFADHPTAQWTAKQPVQAFPFDTAPRYLLRNRDAFHGEGCRHRFHSLGIAEVLVAPRAPSQSRYAERPISSFCRDSLDHAIVYTERHLMRLPPSNVRYLLVARAHPSLAQQSPALRQIALPGQEPVITSPHLGGPYPEYRRAVCKHRSNQSGL